MNVNTRFTVSMARDGARRTAFLGAVLLLASLATGCSSDHFHERRTSEPAVQTGPIPVGTSVRSLAIDGVRRTFRVHRPERLPARAPLVVVLHGGFGSGVQAESAYGWDRLADREGFVVAYPDGLFHAWNAGGGCCGPPGRRAIDDVGFVLAVVSSIGDALPIDVRRTFATGISNGGMLAYRLACSTSTFAAIGPVAATELGSCEDPEPLSVIHVHGAADTNIRLDGRQGAGVARIDGPPVADLIGTWRRVDGCPSPTTVTTGAVTVETASCPSGRAVELVTVAGAGHQWPGSQPNPRAERLGLGDRPSDALDATAAIWSFFEAHPRRDR